VLNQLAYFKICFLFSANWQADGVGYDATTGMTYDGVVSAWFSGLSSSRYPLFHSTGRIFNLTTGLLQGPAWSFSAASKESLHVAVLARAVGGNPLAQELYSVEKAVGILTTKIASMEAWNATYPGFGGFLPWFQNGNTSITLLDGWTNRTPALDNGEVLCVCFSVFVCARVRAVVKSVTSPDAVGDVRGCRHFEQHGVRGRFRCDIRFFIVCL
jgi:hypothetical protein